MNKLLPKEIETLLIKISQRIEEVLNPEYILIGGSFGKGSWLYNGSQLLSDFELVFVCKKKWSIKKKKKLLKSLNDDYPVEISLKGFLTKKVKKRILSNYAFRNPGYLSLDFYDTFQEPYYLYSKDEHGLNLNLDSRNIPLWEAWRLIINRIGELLIFENSNNNDLDHQSYIWVKIFESLADAYLISKGKYVKLVDKRLVLIEMERIGVQSDLGNRDDNYVSILINALSARSRHDLNEFIVQGNVKEFKKMLNVWLDYFEKNLISRDGFNENDKLDFIRMYIKNYRIQNNYLGFNLGSNIVISNTLRVLYNPRLVNGRFKFYNHLYSWRHISLLSVSCLYKEMNSEVEDLSMTSELMSILIPKGQLNRMNKIELVKNTLNYWKILR